MAIDLSALEVSTLPSPAEVAESQGKPLMIPVADIEEDPDQPRKEFNDESMAEMVASIKAVGVKTPVSVRPHPNKPGKYLLNYGARRYRGSIGAGKKTIPAFVDESHTDYDQVTENLQRENLTPMELALFISRKLQDGDKRQDIAKRLGKGADLVTFHMALIDAPAVIEDAYASGRCRSPQSLYLLRTLQEKYPEPVDRWYAEGNEITRGTIDLLGKSLKGGGSGKSAENFVMTKNPVAGGSATGEGGQSSAGKSAGDSGPARTPGDSSFPTKNDPTTLKKPLLVVEFNKKQATALLNRRPTEPGMLWVKMAQSGDVIEVEASTCKITALMEEKE